MLFKAFYDIIQNMDTALAIDELQQKNDALQSQVSELTAMVAKMGVLIKHYEEQLLMARRQRFGSSSERTVDCRQISLFNEVEKEADKSVPEPQVEEITYKRKKRVGKRGEDLSGLPVERVDYELPETERGCSECGETMQDIGIDVRRELKLIPAKVVVVEHAAHVYACHNCEKTSDHTPIVKASAPAPLISGSLASPSLVAHITVQKYSNGMPLYRIEKGFQFDGVIVSRQTMANWVIKCAETYLLAIYILLKTFLLKESVLHADETTFQVLHEPGRKAQSKSYEWIYRTGACSEHKIVIYDYKETREKERPKAFLKDFKGFLHTDGYEAYHDLG